VLLTSKGHPDTSDVLFLDRGVPLFRGGQRERDGDPTACGVGLDTRVSHGRASGSDLITGGLLFNRDDDELH
jgi:hypothetical protein